MTESQIKHVIENHGYSMNTWTDLSEFSIIFLDQNSKLFMDKKHRRYRFNTSSKTLEISNGVTVKNIYTSNWNETSNFTPNNFISFDIIAGFIQTSKISNNGQILYRQ